MTDKPTVEEISLRITEHLKNANNEDEKREISIVWDGYLASLIEWGMITVNEHENLTKLIPKVDNNPVMRIFLGFED